MPPVVGRYRLKDLIGEGAMADVYRAHDPSIDRPLAIKILKDAYRRNAEYAARFLREARAAGGLSHPNIVTIFDVGEADGYPYIAMELLEGEPLDVRLERDGALPAAQVTAIGLQLADALRYAHEAGVIHRDLKPSNILLDPRDGTIKILDFGIARVAEQRSDFEAQSLLTQVGQVLGTPRYMSPEQALGEPSDGRADLFSVGAILYELITGRKAFDGASPATLALQITQDDPPPIASLAPQTPTGLQFIVAKLMAKRPERRYADGAELAEALRREQRAHEAMTAEAAVTRRRYMPLPFRLTLALGAIAAFVLAGAIGTVTMRQHRALEQMAITSGAAVTSFVASNVALSAAENAVLPADQRDWLPAQAFVKVAAEDRNVAQMMVVDAEGVVRAASDPALVGRPYRAAAGERVAAARPDLRITHAETGAKAAFRFVRPITYAGRAVGQVDVSLSKAELNAAAALTRALMIGLGLAVLGVILIATYSLTRLLAAPIGRLNGALAEAGKGNLEFRISHRRADEFGELFDGFNRLAQQAQDRIDAAEARAVAAVKPATTRQRAKVGV